MRSRIAVCSSFLFSSRASPGRQPAKATPQQFSPDRRWRCSTISREWRVGREIRAREVRVVGADGEQLGVFPTEVALRMADEAELDLVEVAPGSRPPVCRLLDYGRFKYEQSKRDKENRKRQKATVVKEIRMSAKTDRHDFEVKARNAERFLRDGDRVKVSVRLRGREIVHAALVRDRMLAMATSLEEVGVVERQPFLEGRQMVMILIPKKSGHKEREHGEVPVAPALS